MALDDFLANGQAHARARVLVTGVEALEDQKDPVAILRVQTDAVVLDAKDPPVFCCCSGNSDVWWPFVAVLAFPIKFWNNCVSRVASARTVGSDPMATPAPDSAMAARRLATACSHAIPESVTWSSFPFVVIRE